LPPSLVLEVMKILEKEMALREETRTLEQARAAIPAESHAVKADALADTQGRLADRVRVVIERIQSLPDGESQFPRELALLGRVAAVMSEARDLLAEHITGPPAIAAETEAIELLLQSGRVNPRKGGGGGSTPGGGSTGTTDDSALALLGRGDEQNASFESRTVGQSTGSSGGDLPAEFRAGLDAFFDALEQSRASGPR
jgi:hypothetical protein